MKERLYDLAVNWDRYPSLIMELRMRAEVAKTAMEAYIRYQDTRQFNVKTGEVAKDERNEALLAKAQETRAQFYAVATPEAIIKMLSKPTGYTAYTVTCSGCHQRQITLPSEAPEDARFVCSECVSRLAAPRDDVMFEYRCPRHGTWTRKPIDGEPYEDGCPQCLHKSTRVNLKPGDNWATPEKMA
jgi:hypothetical protein